MARNKQEKAERKAEIHAAVVKKLNSEGYADEFNIIVKRGQVFIVPVSKKPPTPA